MLLSSWLAGLLSAGAVWAAPGPVGLEDGSHCVAYRVEKVMFLVSSKVVVGRNCEISAQVLPEIGGLYRIEVNVPVAGFKSGEPERDKDVQKILKADVKPEMIFRSKALSADEWRTLFAKKDFDVEGELSIGDKSYPLKVQSRYSEKEEGAQVAGVARTNFEQLELKPPRIVGGIVVKTKKEIELDFNLLAGRILGADSLLPKAEARQ